MLPLAFAAPWAGYIVLDLHALLRDFIQGWK